MTDLRPECKGLFERTHDELIDIKVSLGQIRKAVLGNGNPKDSLASRVTALEATADEQGRGRDRFWKVASVGIAALAVLIACLK